jgi:hypothetical protein
MMLGVCERTDKQKPRGGAARLPVSTIKQTAKIRIEPA